MTPQLDEAEQLLGAAERDVVAFQILAANAAAPPEIVLFHAQQAVEKFIKAVFAAQGLVYPRTHDLLLLWQTANEQGLAIPAEFEPLVNRKTTLPLHRCQKSPGPISRKSQDKTVRRISRIVAVRSADPPLCRNPAPTARWS